MAASSRQAGIVTSLPSELSGAIAGRYILEGVIGRGGTSVVYRARDDESGRAVAVKLLREELVESSGAKRFLREIRVLGILQHPNIIPVLDSGESGGRLFVVLPFMDGGTLRMRLDREKQLPLPEALRISTVLCSALSFAHEQGVIHRDVKPENILFSGDTPCLADFGIARAIERAIEDATTTTGAVVGTPAYMSPEQASGERNLDPRSDVYSLGCVVYEMIAGMQAFSGPSKRSVIAQHMTYGPRPLRIYRPSVPPALEQVIEKAMMGEPADRYQSAAEFGRALASAPTEAVAGGEDDAQSPAWKTTRRSTRLRRRRAWQTVIAAGIVIGVAGSWLRARARGAPLDPNKVVVFPLVERGGGRPGGNSGDEVALLIGSVLEHTEPLKWIDGWTWLDSTQRTNPARLTARQARSIARSRGARFYLEGALLERTDSVTVVTRLIDVEGDSTFAQNSATGPTRPESFSILGLRAVVQLLPRLVDPSRRVDLRSIAERNPAAIASFLQGEREYRQSHFVNALAHYRRAVESDSGLTFAALKGAQAANWADSNATARQLLALTLSRQASLPPKYAHFAHGLDDFLKGSADSSAQAFRRALDVDAGWSEAWTALGEVYFHLFPVGTGWDSVAQVAFERARREDPEFAPPVFHLTQLALRNGQLSTATLLLGTFRRFHPEADWLTELQLTVDCARGSMQGAAWRRWAHEYPIPVAKASRSLAMLARRYDCAEDGFRAVLGEENVSVQGRWMAALGLQSLLIGTGRIEGARRVVDSVVAKGLRQAMTLYIIDAAAGFGGDSDAAQAMKLLAGRYDMMPGYRLWYHATWQRHLRNVDSLAAIDAVLRSNADRSLTNEDRFFANVSAANLAVARGDTTTAIRLLRGLHPQGDQGEITWGLWQPVAAERLSLARLLLARGEFGDALRIGDGFDHPQPVVDLIFLPASLVIRVQAAHALRDPNLEQRYRQELVLLGRTDLLKSLP